MKKIFAISLSLSIGFVFLFTTFDKAIAAKKNPRAQQTLKVLSNEGEAKVYGSILNPRRDEINILLNKDLIAKLRKEGLSKLSINLISSLDSTKTYSVSSDAINIQRKVINKKPGKYLVVSIFNLTSPSGITVSPSSLPPDDYKLRITGEELDLTTDSFSYETPALVVGNVDSEETGLVSIEDLSGEKISDRTVATNPNGTFFTEVTADRIKLAVKARKYLKSQVDETTDEEFDDEIDTGVVHCVTTDKDLLAVVPLDNDPENNAAISNEPIEVDESSTFTANLAKENEDLAVEIAKDTLEDLATEDSEDEQDLPVGTTPQDIGSIGCNIEQFSNRCSENETKLASLGADFKKFIVTATCNFPEFKLIQNIIPKLPDSANAFIGKGYCEHINREVDEDKPCEIYSQILSEFKAGQIKQLPCPPNFCDEFSNIRPPKCVNPVGICGEGHGPVPPVPICTGPNCPPPPQNQCFHKPQRDLYCARVGTDIKAEECKDEDFGGPSQFKPGWIITTNSKGNQFCVPSNIPQPSFPAGFNGPKPPSTPEEVAEQCELNKCHSDCAVKFGFNNGPIQGPILPGSPLENASRGLHECHFACDAEAGRVADCGNTSSKYFSIKCCSQGAFGPPTLFTHSAFQFSPPSSFGSPSGGFSGPSGGFSGPPPGGFGPPSGGFSGPSGGFSGPPSGFSHGGFSPGKGPIQPDTRRCLCEDPNNFNEKGFIKEDAQSICKDKCPQGYEKNSNGDNCLPICLEGTVRDPGGICRKKCPEGTTQDNFGNCNCPPGQFVGAQGKCETQICPDFCKPFLSSTSSAAMPPECKSCFGGPGICPPGQRKDLNSGQCIPENNKCGIGQYVDQNGICRCSDGSVATSLGPEGCKKQYCTPAESPSTSNCTCAPGATQTGFPISPNSGNACQCPNNQPYTISGCGSTSTNYCPPGITPSSFNPCTCGPGAIFDSNGFCKCSTPGQIYTKEYGCGTTTNRVCVGSEVPTATNSCTCAFGATPSGPGGTCQCTNGKPYTGLTTCDTQTTNYCSPGISISTGCTCGPGATVGAGNTCHCPTGQAYTKETGCSSTSRPCTAGEGPSNNCYCFGGGYTGTDGKCQCTGGIQYTGGGCSSTTSHVCAAGEAATTANPCYCAGSATFTGPSGTGTCQCPSGSSIAYSAQGCGSTSTNYCYPGILVGTSGCTCNPSGGAYNSGGYCTCPSGSSSPYAPTTGCGTSTTSRACTAGEGPSNGCYCFGSGYTGTDGKCQCSGGIQYTGGGCGSTTTHTCALGEVNTSSNPCTCASGATFGSNSQCQCTNGQVYASGGCPGSTTTNRTCVAGEVATTSNPCTCATGATFNASNSCVCTNGHAYTVSGCETSTSHTCSPGEVPTATNSCTCAGSATFGSGNTCQCPSGQTYTLTGCSGSTSTCPSSTPIVCSDGSCATTQANCPCPSSTPIRCSDNTCATTQATCPCPSSTPFKCSDGTCATTQATCPCPSSTPIRCANNTCATTQANCPQ